ncbi:ABC transporter ATP-binding protein [Ancylobacter terrae]|uniref:ABC transporter ATP-binding protein n=1 Tax=Ancylobacter sp. sgz301288 TaxID=3342077 RepID=UPI00385F2F9E
MPADAAQSSTPAVLFRGVTRHFGAVKAVDGVDLSIAPGEFFAMLGPSGSGKTTCLRLIAGFEQPDSGHIELFGETMEGLPPYRRAVNTVFQDYALFPHLSVGDNVAYGLRVRGVGRAERDRLAREALAMVKLAGMEARRPSQLSGGQRQRVALARALVVRPKVLLLDEPLGALDLKLREEMQAELKSLQRALGLSFVFVTHDQSEALSMADRVAVFNEGRIVQVGPPEEVYERPATRFVAGFVGSANVLSAAEVSHFGLPARPMSLRPEKIALLPPGQPAPAGAFLVDVTILDASYQGPVRRLIGRDATGLVLAAAVPAEAAAGMTPGTPARFSFAPVALQPMEGEG